MPLYRFAGPGPYYFPASRDARGVPLGDVQPGDVRDLDEPVGQWWVPADGEPPPGPESDEERARAAMAAAAETPPDGPVPAPPAIVP
jgi:hypothetical protein